MQTNHATIRSPAAPRPISFTTPALFVAAVSILEVVLTPVAVLAAALGAWRLSADPGWTSTFFIAGGLLSRYQLWFAVAMAAQMSALFLNRWPANHPIDLPGLVPKETQS